MKFIDKIRRKTEKSIPKEFEKEIKFIKEKIEYQASHGKNEYQRCYYNLKYLNGIYEYFEMEGFDVTLKEIPYFGTKELIIRW